MKAKNILISVIISLIAFGGAWDQAFAGVSGKKPLPWKKNKHKPKPAKPVKPVVRSTHYGGQAVAVNLTNELNGTVWRLAGTGPSLACGGAIDRTIGPTNLDNSLFVDGAQVAVSGIACVTTAAAAVTNFSAVFVQDGITNTIAFTFAAAEARAECTSNGVVLSASSLVEGLTIDGASVAVTGEANQVILLAGGSLVLNAQTSWLSTNGQQGAITVAAIYVMLTNGFNGPIAYADAGIRCGTRVPPSVGVCDKVTGGGFITGTPSGANGSFGVAGGIRRGAFWGHLNYIDHGTGMHVQSTAVTGNVAVDPVTRQIDYDVLIDGVAGTARVIVADNGQPGRNDIFDITLSNGYHAGGDLGGAGPGGGNIKIHKCPPGWRK